VGLLLRRKAVDITQADSEQINHQSQALEREGRQANLSYFD
jgi:hypothetical protein